MKSDTLKKELEKDGYSKEELYFHELNRKLRKKRNEEREKAEVKPATPAEAPLKSNSST